MIYKDLESTTLEFKREVPRKDQILKTAIGFSNQYGGRIMIGVNDDRSILGIAEDKVDDIIDTLNRSIFDSCTPPVFPRIYSQRLEDKVVIIVDISEGTDKPYFRTTEGLSKGTYIRMGSSTIKASPEIIRELQWLREGKTYDETPAYHAGREDLDDELILDFLRRRKSEFKGGVNNKVLKSYKLLVESQSRMFPTVGALLLFGRDPQKHLSESFIICTHFKGVSGREAIASVDCSGNLFQQIEEALQFVFSRLYKSYVIKRVRRKESLEIPESAIREIVINAVAHRNYMIKGPTKIAIYEDRLEIHSPGLFPGPLDTTDLEQGITYLRNTVITRVFREAGIVEKLGSGFITLFSSYRDYGLERPTVIEGMNYVKCILPRKTTGWAMEPEDGYPDSVMESSETRIPRVVAPEGDAAADCDFILGLFRQADTITMNLVLKKTSWARATAGRRLKKLMDAGKITKIGAGRYCHYRLVEAPES